MAVLQLYGRLIDRTGQPAAGVGATLVASSVKGSRTLGATVSDSNGGFFLPFAWPSNGLRDFALELSSNAKPVKLENLEGVPENKHLVGPVTVVVEHAPPVGRTVAAPRHPMAVPQEELTEAWKL